MSDTAQGPGWWMASDGRWYAPHLHPSYAQGQAAVDAAAGPMAVSPGAGEAPGLPPYAPAQTFGSGLPAVLSSRPARPPRRRRRPVVVSVAAALAIALVAGVVVETQGPGTTADAAIVHAVDTAMAGNTADIDVTGSETVQGHSVTFSGSGAVEFGTDALSMNLGLASQGQQITEQAVYLGGVVYESLPQIAQVYPGKSWVSLDLSWLTQATGQGVGGLGGNPLAMLHALAVQGNTVTDLGTTTLDGSPVHEYGVTLDPTVIQHELAQANLPAWLQQAVSQVTVDSGSQKVYVGSDGTLAGVRYSVVETVGSAGPVPVDESLTFSHYGTATSITAPPADEVIPLSQLLQQGG